MNFYQKTKSFAAFFKRTAQARYYENQGNYEAAIDQMQEVLHLAEQLRGRTSQIYLQNFLTLGFYHRRKGDVAAAKRIYEEFIRLLQSVEEENSSQIRNVKFLIARCQADLEEWDAARDNLLELLDYHQKAAEPDTQNVENLIYMLAAVYHGRGDYEEARRNYLEALELLRQKPDYKKEDEAWVYRELGVLAISQENPKNYSQAEIYLLEALDILSRVEIGKADSRKTIWQDLVSLYLRMGELNKAVEAAHKSSEELQAIIGENYYFLAEHFGVLSKLLEKAGAYASALNFSQRQLSTLRQQPAPTDKQLAECLKNIAHLYGELLKYDEAESYYNQAIAIYKVIGDTDSKQKREIEQDLAILKHQAGKKVDNVLFTQGSPKDNAATEIEKTDELEKECFFLFAAQRYLEAAKIVRQIIELARENSDDKRLREYLMFAGRIWQEVGDTEAAEQAYLESLKYLDESRGEDKETIALIYNNLSQLYADDGNLAKADKAIQRSLKLTAGIAHENPDAFTKNLNNASSLYSVIGDISRAVSYMERALTELSAQGLRKSILYASILTHLSMLKLKNKEMTEATAIITEALIIFQEQKEGREYATALNAFGMIVLALGDMTSAERAFRESIEVLEKIQGFDSHPNTKIAKGNLAFTYLWQEKYEEAENLYAEILGSIDKPYAKVGLIDVENLFFRGLGFLALGKPEQSLQCLEVCVAGSERFIDNAFAFSTESQRMQVLAESTKNFYALLSLVRANFSQNLEVVQRMLSVVLRRKALGIEALIVQREMVMSGQYPHLATALHELITLQQKIAGLLLRPPDENSEDLDRQLGEAEARRIDIEANLARQIPEIRLTQKLREVDYAKIADILPEGSVLIEFVGEQKIFENSMPVLEVFSSPHYTAFVIPAKNPNGIKLFDLGAVEEINQMIQHFLYRITKKGEFDDSGQQLYAKLIEPWINEIGKNRKCFLSPDGELNRLPFEALPLNDEQRFIDKYLTVYVGSGRDLLRHQIKSGTDSTKSLVVANPDFDLEVKNDKTPDNKSSQFHGLLSQNNLEEFPLDSLEMTENEGKIVAEMLDTTPLTGKEAVETKIKEILKTSPHIVHFATHGMFFTETDHQEKISNSNDSQRQPEPALKNAVKTTWTSGNPLLRSCLALAGINTVVRGGQVPTEAGDGVLTALDISGLNLARTELVVLSACKTGTGDIQNGEGVWGLRRAFELAGAKTLVVSLWEVDDSATAELMKIFYKGLKAGIPCAEALHDAKLLLRKSKKQSYFWAPFICQGNPEPIIDLKNRKPIYNEDICETDVVS